MSTNPSKKILVVDDESEALTHLGNILRRANYEVVSTTSGKAAIELARLHHPDLIILDIVMPEVDGGDVAEILSQSPSTAAIPIIFLTGILTKEEEKTTTGKHLVIAKPTTANEVLKIISRVLEKDVKQT